MGQAARHTHPHRQAGRVAGVVEGHKIANASPLPSGQVHKLKPEEGDFRVNFFSPETTDDNIVKWKNIFDDLFR